MSNQNDGFQEQKGYVPPAGTQADEQRRAREWEQQQRSRDNQRAQEEAMARQQREQEQQQQRTRREREASRKRLEDSKRRGGVAIDRPSPPKKKVKKTKFSYFAATVAAIAIAIYLGGNTELEAMYLWIFGIIGGIIVGYKYKWILVIGIVFFLYYHFLMSASQKRKFKRIVFDKPFTHVQTENYSGVEVGENKQLLMASIKTVIFCILTLD